MKKELLMCGTIILTFVCFLCGCANQQEQGNPTESYERSSVSAESVSRDETMDAKTEAESVSRDETMDTKTEEVYYQYNSWLETRELSIPAEVIELGNVLEEQLKEGTLPDFLEEHVSDYRELSFSEIQEKIAADKVLKQYYISENQPDDQWFCMEGSEDIWIRKSCEWEGTPYWNYYKFPHLKYGYDISLDASSFGEEYFFFAWEGIDYLVTISRDEKGDIAEVSTHYLLNDSVINGWVLRQTLEENGEITVKCLDYWVDGLKKW